MARFRHAQGPTRLSLEASIYDVVGARLAEMGHAVRSISGEDVGGVQVIQIVPAAAGTFHYRGGSDFRKDGQAVGW